MYVQSGVQKIEVRVLRDGSPASEKGNKEVGPEEIANGEDKGFSDRKKKRIILTNVTHIMATARQVLNTRFNYWQESQAIEHGDTVLEDNINRTFEKIGDPLNIATSVVMGGVYGAWGGPVGAFIGASMGLITSTVSVATKYQRRGRDYSVKMFKENNAIEYKRARANINLTTGRLR